MNGKQLLVLCTLICIFKNTEGYSKSFCTEYCTDIGQCYGSHGSSSCTCGCQGCFPGDSVAMLVSGQTVKMSQLKTGEKVQAVSSDGRIIFSELRTFFHKESLATSLNVSLMTSFNKTTYLSGKHLIYVKRSRNDKFNIIRANQVMVGDQLLIPQSNDLSLAKVNNVSYIKMKGLFSPLTMEGNIVINGVLASCYSDFDHYGSHIVTAPFRWFPEILEWIFGNDNGFQTSAKMAQEFSNFCQVPTLHYY